MCGIGTFSMNVSCMLYEYDIYVTYACQKWMGYMQALGMLTCKHAWDMHVVVYIMVTCMPHACSIHYTHTYIWFMHALTNLLYCIMF